MAVALALAVRGAAVPWLDGTATHPWLCTDNDGTGGNFATCTLPPNAPEVLFNQVRNASLLPCEDPSLAVLAACYKVCLS